MAVKSKEPAVYIIICILMILMLGGVLGYLMNFQNLFEYWKDDLGSVEMPWIVSMIGVFIPIVGVFTGWYF